MLLFTLLTLISRSSRTRPTDWLTYIQPGCKYIWMAVEVFTWQIPRLCKSAGAAAQRGREEAEGVVLRLCISVCVISQTEQSVNTPLLRWRTVRGEASVFRRHCKQFTVGQISEAHVHHSARRVNVSCRAMQCLGFVVLVYNIWVKVDTADSPYFYLSNLKWRSKSPWKCNEWIYDIYKSEKGGKGRRVKLTLRWI